jgi:fructose-1,6-bisphosphatase/inositol monophosphatase family enzyme
MAPHEIPFDHQELARLLAETRGISGNESFKVTTRCDRDITTKADGEVDAYLKTGLRELIPGSAFLSEESTPTDSPGAPGGTFTWRVDPIDGTINFARDLPFYSTALSLETAGSVLLAAVYFVEQNYVLVASRGAGVARFDVDSQGGTKYAHQCHVTPRPLEQTLTSIMLTPKLGDRSRALTTSLAGFLTEHTQGVRVLVSQALEAAALSQGQIDAVISLESRDGWTRPTATLMTVEAGGIAKSFEYRSPSCSSGFFLAGSPAISTLLEEWLETNGYGKPEGVHL